MKRMITNVGGVLLLMALVVLTTTSCNDGPGEGWWSSYATVKGTQLDFYLKTDDGKTLLIAKNEVPGFKVENNMRVIANYTYVKEEKPTSSSLAGKQIELKMLYGILTKTPRLESTLDSIAQDTIGHDPVYVRDVWCCEGYINAEFEIKVSSGQHSINLVVDDTKSTATDLYTTFRHNAFNDYPEKTSYGAVSFRGRQLMAPGADTVRVHVAFTDYYGNKLEKSATLHLVDPPASEKERSIDASTLSRTFE